VVTAAEPYVRILIRVPVAYHLMRQYKCTRPGLMVLDADGRRVDAIPLGAKKAGQVAEWLRDALAAPAYERLTVRFATADREAEKGFWKRILEIDGIENGPTNRDGTINLTVKAGGLHPEKVEALARAAGLELTLVQPLAVKLTPRKAKAGDLEALKKAPGTWYVSRRGPARAFVSRVFLNPAALATAAPDLTTDLETFAFRLERVLEGNKDCAIALSPIRIKGVLSVLPDASFENVTVVARRGTVKPKALLGAFAKAGGSARVASASSKDTDDGKGSDGFAGKPGLRADFEAP
jgi:hypothetical protein